jgi:signal transduction histidine kinase
VSPDLRQLLEAIVSNVEEAITVIDPTGCFVFVNDGAARVLGFSSASELMRAEPQAVRSRYQLVDAQRAPLDPRLLPSRRAFSGESPPELLVGWRTGTMNELRWSITRAVPVKTADGRVEVVINFFRDVTEKLRQKAEERLLANATLLFSQSLDLDRTLQQLADTVVPELADWAIVEVVDEPGSRSRPQRVAMAHVESRKLEWAKEVSRRWPSRWDPDAPYGLAVVLRSGQPQMFPKVTREMLQAAAHDVEHLEMLERIGMQSVLYVPVRAPGRTVYGALTLITAEGRRTYDTRDLDFALELGLRAGTAIANARLFAAVEHASQQKDEFLAMLAHELRNPLGPMVNAVELAQRQPDTAPRAHRVIDRQLKQLTRLVDDLLDVSRISRGKIELQRQALDLGVLAADVVDDQLEAFAAAGLELKIERSGELGLNGDPVRLQQVIGNLLGNALKFTPRGGLVWVRVRAVAGQVTLSVTDTGQGIDAATLSKLFQPFVQTRRALDRENGGLGLGLAVVRGIVELHGGRVTASSKGSGQGTTFEVSLPVDRREQTPAPQPGAGPAARGQRRLRVLVIDDNVELASTMQQLLAYEAKEVEVEHSGAAAVERIRRMKPDVVICDIGLPQKDGYAIAAEVRSDPALDHVKLVALSGYGMEADKARASKAGFSVHLTKPVPPAQLFRVLDETPSS